MTRRMAELVALVLTLGLMCPTTRAAEPEPPATMEELNQLFKAGEYQPLVLKATRVLQLKGDAAKPYDRVKVFMLKGEAQLRLKQTTPALDAFASAAKEAKDFKEAATPIATEALVRKSPGFKYSVKPTGGGKPESLDILDDAQRKKAFAALYADEVTATTAKFRAAARATSLPAIVEAIKLAPRLRALELAADGTDDKTLASIKDLGTHAEELMKDGLSKMNATVMEISKSANTLERSVDSYGSVTTRKRGINPQETRTLRNLVDTAGKISTTAKEMGDVTAVATLSGVSKEAERVGTEAQKLLDTDWDPLKNKRAGGKQGGY
jgi:hypothetical protein